MEAGNPRQLNEFPWNVEQTTIIKGTVFLAIKINQP